MALQLTFFFQVREVLLDLSSQSASNICSHVNTRQLKKDASLKVLWKNYNVKTHSQKYCLMKNICFVWQVVCPEQIICFSSWNFLHILNSNVPN